MASELQTTDEIAAAMRECVYAWAPDARLIGNIRAVDIASVLDERDEHLARIKELEQVDKKSLAAISRMQGAIEMRDKMLDEIHRAAGCKRDGLAGILGWIDEALDAISKVGGRDDE